MTGSTYDVSAEAIENCRIKVIRVNKFMQLLQKYPEASMAVTQSALSKYQQAFEEIRRLTLPQTVAGRIASLLLEWEKFYRKKAPAEDRLIVAVTREELAELTGTSRETVSRTLHEFRRKNLISIKGSSIQILNRQELERIAS